jgi:hypothetical protein
MEIKIYLAKNNKKEKPTHPDLRLSQITEDGEFLDIGALWLSKDPNKKSYTGRIDMNKVQLGPKPVEEPVEDADLAKVAAVFETPAPKVDNYPASAEMPGF